MVVARHLHFGQMGLPTTLILAKEVIEPPHGRSGGGQSTLMAHIWGWLRQKKV